MEQSQIRVEDSDPLISIDDFRKALGQLAAGVSIVATQMDGSRRGVTATAVCSVTDSPGTVLVCINRNTGTGKMIADSGYFSVNVLGLDHEDVAMTFAGAKGVQGDERFNHGDWHADKITSLPILDQALVNMACEVSHTYSTATHDVFFGKVLAVHTAQAQPLIYFDRQFHETSPRAA